MIVLIPSYGRPHSVERMHIALNHMNTTAEVVWVVDIDDWALFDYVDAFERYGCNYFAVEGGSLVESLNAAVGVVLTQVPELETLAWIADDMLPLTSQWDLRLEESVGKLGIAYGNDSIQGQNLPTHFAISTSILRKLGFIFPPEFHHLYTDNYIKRVGEEAGILTYNPDVVFDHMHPLVAKAETDETYTAAWSKEDSDLRAYLNHNYQETNDKIKELM